MKKKVMAIICVVAILFSLNAGMAASSGISESIVDQALRQKGFPSEVLQHMHLDAKMEYYNDQTLEFSNAQLICWNEGEGVSYIKEYGEGGISPYGTIPTSDLNLLIIGAKSISNGNLIGMLVTLNYEWVNLPIDRFEDPMCIRWDSDKFMYRSGSFVKKDYFDAKAGSATYNDIVFSQSTSYENIDFGAIMWSADLKGHITSQDPDGYTAITGLHGYGQIRVDATIPLPAGVTPIYGQYVHVKTDVGLGISFGPFGISYSSGAADSLGCDSTIEW